MGSIQFTNTKDRVVSPSINIGSAFTFAGWIKVEDGFSGAWNRFLCTDDHKTGFFIGQGGNTGKWKFAVNNVWALPDSGSIVPGQWQHLAGTYDGTNGRLYIDGTLVAGPAAMPAPSNPNQPFVLGKDAPDHENSFQGLYDQIKIYRRALNSQEILSLYNRENDMCSNRPQYDLDGDCQVSLSDFLLLSVDWLTDSPEPGESSLLGKWHLDGNTFDASGNSKNGILEPASSGSISYVLDGRNKSIKFADTKDRVVFPRINLGSAFTAAGWVKVEDGFSGSWNRFLCTDNAQTGFYLGQAGNSDQWKFTVNNSTVLPSGGTIMPGQWQHVAGTYDGCHGRFYVDGVFVAGPAAMPKPSSPFQLVVLGKDSPSHENSFAGFFDEVRVYDRALSNEEIQNLYDLRFDECLGFSKCDLDRDCQVGVSDLSKLAGQWLKCGQWEFVPCKK